MTIKPSWNCKSSTVRGKRQEYKRTWYIYYALARSANNGKGGMLPMRLPEPVSFANIVSIVEVRPWSSVVLFGCKWQMGINRGGSPAPSSRGRLVMFSFAYLLCVMNCGDPNVVGCSRIGERRFWPRIKIYPIFWDFSKIQKVTWWLNCTGWKRKSPRKIAYKTWFFIDLPSLDTILLWVPRSDDILKKASTLLKIRTCLQK